MILRSFRSIKGLKIFLVLRPQFFKSLRPSKTLKMVLRPRPVLDYITGNVHYQTANL